MSLIGSFRSCSLFVEAGVRDKPLDLHVNMFVCLLCNKVLLIK
jgi:hypothetical protein